MADRDANNTDWISHLPPEIIEKILILLPCHEAVRTSILSSDWRYKWTSMSDLNFGQAWGAAYKHANFITQCLRRHQGPIRKFSVTARKLTVARKIEQWIKLVSTHDIEQLKLQVNSWYSFRHGSFGSSSCLFNCKKLTHLELTGFLLDVPPTFEGFMNLKVLILSSIKVKDKSSVESLISKSPILESLSLCEVSCDSDISIIISALKIKYLSMQGDLKSIGLEKSPLLVDMSLCSYRASRECDLIKILGAAPNLEKLSLHLNFQLFEQRFKFGCYRGVLSTTFSHLKVMTLGEFYLGERKAIPLVIELLTSAPNLEKLDIHNVCSHSLPNEADSDFWQKEYLVGHCFMKLKVVEMGDILCMAPEIEFVKFILSNSHIEEIAETSSCFSSSCCYLNDGDGPWREPNCSLD